MSCRFLFLRSETAASVGGSRLFALVHTDCQKDHAARPSFDCAIEARSGNKNAGIGSGALIVRLPKNATRRRATTPRISVHQLRSSL